MWWINHKPIWGGLEGGGSMFASYIVCTCDDWHKLFDITSFMTCVMPTLVGDRDYSYVWDKKTLDNLCDATIARGRKLLELVKLRSVHTCNIGTERQGKHMPCSHAQRSNMHLQQNLPCNASLHLAHQGLTFTKISCICMHKIGHVNEHNGK